jgi:hypothetical protein
LEGQSARRFRGWPSHLPLARLRTQEQEAADDPARGGVSTPLLIASAAAGLCSYSALRLSGQPPAGCLAATLLGAAGNSHRIAGDTDRACRRSHASFMDVPTLWWADGRRRALDCRSDPHACTTTSSGRGLVKRLSTCRQHRVPRPSYSSCASSEQTSACIVPATFRRACFCTRSHFHGHLYAPQSRLKRRLPPTSAVSGRLK